MHITFTIKSVTHLCKTKFQFNFDEIYRAWLTDNYTNKAWLYLYKQIIYVSLMYNLNGSYSKLTNATQLIVLHIS